MNCQDCESLISELAREQMMDASIRSQALAHSNSCPQCSMKLADERQLTVGLRALAGEMGSIAVPNRIEGQVLAAYRAQRFEHARRPQIFKRFSVGVAAALLVVFGLTGMRVWLNEGNQSIPPNASVAQTIGQKSPPVLIVEPVSIQKPKSGNGTTKRTHRLKGVVVARKAGDKTASAKDELSPSVDLVATDVNNNEAEVATEFMPLGYVNPMALQEGGQIVRVEFPRSAMLSLGLPVNMDRYGERVKADVLVGADGLARAIRFLQ